MYSGNNLILCGTIKPPDIDDCDNLYADNPSIATFISASLASDNDDCCDLSTAVKNKLIE